MAMIERQHGRVEGRPDQDISQRVTHVYRREGDTWYLVHRHADPLVDVMSLDDHWRSCARERMTPPVLRAVVTRL